MHLSTNRFKKMSKRSVEEDNVCSFFLKKKKRPCRMKAAEGMTYCPHHSHLGSVLNSKKGPRIPCPLDSSHFCYESMLQKHLKKCNAREKDKPEYFVQNINNDTSEPHSDKILIGSISDEDLMDCINKVKNIYNKLSVEIESVTSLHPVLEGEMQRLDDGFNSFKHMKQQASLLSLMRERGLLEDHLCFVEFGAGKGELMYWIVKCVPNSQTNSFVLVDRSAQRHKSDNKFKGSEIQIQRIRIDIQHLHLGKIPNIKNKLNKVVGVSKHLCGGATDLALRCLLNTLTDEEGTEKVDNKPFGLLMALCCHHRCSWTSYTGKEFMEKHSITEKEFNIMCCMASWNTCGLRKKGNEKTPPNEEDAISLQEQEINRYQKMNLSHEEREEIGFQCKRIIDSGRISYLRAFGFDAQLISYIDKSVSLENIALIATHKAS